MCRVNFELWWGEYAVLGSNPTTWAISLIFHLFHHGVIDSDLMILIKIITWMERHMDYIIMLLHIGRMCISSSLHYDSSHWHCDICNCLFTHFIIYRREGECPELILVLLPKCVIFLKTTVLVENSRELSKIF